ncbi:ABC transporter substrate-binding protein [Micrococcus sp.]|uniref:ABC transporter substrate-binding protein n=1 Tax=Micrococcus sp. TaxID=1271 RepID=UPI002A90BCAF|nr:ABC transporter substrate-binding protein [Micrococcus sp.]MDY6055694.1 ABC transporter substrate-binding protein [Micrococcus sp.]
MQVSRRLLLSTGLAGLGAGLAGCSAPDEAPTSPGMTTTAASSSAGTPPASRTLVVGVPGRPLTRDPLHAWDVESQRVIRQVLEPLLAVDPDTGSPVPGLADHAESGNGLVHTFTLREGLEFSDGSACDAAAVVANIRRWAQTPQPGTPAAALPSPFAAAFGGHAGQTGTAFASAEASDSRTVVLRLRRRLRHLPAALSSPAFGIAAPGSWTRTQQEDGVAVVTPLGTGPYRWAQPEEAAELAAALTSPGATTMLVVNGRHRGPAPEAGAVAVRAWGRAATRLRELRRDRADVIDVVSPAQLRPLVESGTQVLPRDPLSVLYLGMNLGHPVVGRQYVREAIAHAVDRGRLAASDVFLQGTSAAEDLVPPALGARNEDARRHEPNRDRARQLLDLAGYDGRPLEFLYPVDCASPALPEPERVYAMVAAELGEVGIAVAPVPVPGDEDYLAAVLARPTRALHLMGRHGVYRDPHAFLEPFVGSWQTETGYDNPRVRQNLRAAAAEPDDDRRGELFRAVVAAMAIDLPALPLAYPISALATGRRVISYPTSPQLDEPFAHIHLTDR